MKLSIVILCWNDRKVIADCLQSIYSTVRSTEFEVIVSDNGSTDGSIEFIRQHYPQVRLIENGRNLRFAKANNVGIQASRGEYILILNPDTIMHDGTLDRIVQYAEAHPEAGAVACRVLNADGSYQESARPLPSIRSEWMAALYLKPLGYLSDWFHAGVYMGWKGDSERPVGWIMGCFMLIPAQLLKSIGGFDEQFFYYNEDRDLCQRIGAMGHPILFTPDITFVHLGGGSTKKRFAPLTFALDGQITSYMYFYKHFGRRGAIRRRRAAIASALVRWFGYSVLNLLGPNEQRRTHAGFFGALLSWNYQVDPVRLVEKGEEPDLGMHAVQRVLER
jgi:GT2 family glycosyltransferase